MQNKAIKYQAKYYDMYYKHQVFKERDLVCLLAKNFKVQRPSKKLNFKFLGPFKVKRVTSKQTYKLDLLASIDKVFLVFYVLYLEPYRVREGKMLLYPELKLIDDKEEYIVKDILNKWNFASYT